MGGVTGEHPWLPKCRELLKDARLLPLGRKLLECAIAVLEYGENSEEARQAEAELYEFARRHKKR